MVLIGSDMGICIKLGFDLFPSGPLQNVCIGLERINEFMFEGNVVTDHSGAASKHRNHDFRFCVVRVIGNACCEKLDIFPTNRSPVFEEPLEDDNDRIMLVWFFIDSITILLERESSIS